MSDWRQRLTRDAPVGAISLVAICLTAVCFPVSWLFTGWLRYIAAGLLVICGFTFTPAVTCAVYSVAMERLKVLGTVGLLIAALTIWLEPETLYFVEMGILLVPCTLLAMMIIVKRRAKTSGRPSLWW